MNKIVIITTILTIFVIIIFIIIIIYNSSCETFINQNLDNNKYYNEEGQLINHKIEERTEQEQAFKYIDPDDVVLELGGRYGTVSSVINYKLNNKNNHVVIEPDENIIPALIKNRDLNNCGYHILPKIISKNNKKKINNGYGTHYINSEENIENNIISYEDFKKQFPLNFNVLVADCEGCLCEFIDNMGNDFYKLNKIIFEADYPNLCDYNKLIQNLLNNGFTMIDKQNNHIDRYVFMKI
jgi:FkbM family methyltransferase